MKLPESQVRFLYILVAVVLLALVVTLVTGAFLTADSARVPIPEAPTNLQIAPTAAGIGSAVVSPSLEVESTSTGSGAGTDFWAATDYVAFLHKYAARAYAGDGRAAYYVWNATHACWAELDYYQTTGELPQDFERCKRLLTEDPFADLPPRTGGYDRQYWKARALEAGDPLAWLQVALTDDVRGTDVPQQAITRAAASGDPEVLFSLGLALPAMGGDFDEAVAWELAACELGYDCRMSNPRVGMGCVENRSCQAEQMLADRLRDDVGAWTLSKAEKRAAEIVAALDAGQFPEVKR